VTPQEFFEEFGTLAESMPQLPSNLVEHIANPASEGEGEKRCALSF